MENTVFCCPLPRRLRARFFAVLLAVVTKMPFLCILSRLVRGKCGVCLLLHSVFPHFPWCRAGLPAPDEAVPGGEILFLLVKSLFISALLLFSCDSLSERLPFFPCPARRESGSLSDGLIVYDTPF